MGPPAGTAGAVARAGADGRAGERPALPAASAVPVGTALPGASALPGERALSAASALPVAGALPVASGVPATGEVVVAPLAEAGGPIDARSWAAEGPRPAPTRPGDGAAVFVDASGARSRWLLPAGRIAGALCVAYLVATTLSVLGATWVPRLSLPAVGPVLPQAHPLRVPTLPPDALSTPLPAAVAGAGSPSTAPAATALRRPGSGGQGPAAPAAPAAPGGTSAPRNPLTTVAAPPTSVTTPTTHPGHGPPTTAPTSGATTSTPSTPQTTVPPGHSGSAPGKQKHGA